MTDRIEKSVDLNAPVDRVWRAISDHEEFGSWFRMKIDAPFAAGVRSTGHCLYPGYEHVRWDAVVVAIEPPRLLSFRWHPFAVDAGTDYSGEPTTLVEFRLAATAGGTRLTVAESGFDALPPERRDLAFRMNEGGWEEQMRNIAAHVGG